MPGDDALLSAQAAIKRLNTKNFLSRAALAARNDNLAGRMDPKVTVTYWIGKMPDAPVTHRFAVGMEGVAKEEVASMAEEKKEILDSPFQGCTPLDVAIACDNVSQLQELLEMGANPNNNTGAWILENLAGKWCQLLIAGIGREFITS